VFLKIGYEWYNWSMDENNKQEGQENNEKAKGQPSHQHVHIFGAEVNGGAGDTSGDWAKHKDETKEDWRKRKEEWRQQHHAQHEQRRAEWKAQRSEWRHEHHTGGMFWGLILLLAGVLALMYTMGYVSPVFWHAIIPFWPILLILWGASLVLGRHWFTRFILFLFALAFLIIVIVYGLVRAGSPLVSYLSPNVVRAVQTAQPPQY
jgi:cation transport ATPase